MRSLRIVFLLFVTLLTVWSATVIAQDAELTCDEALNEAQVAYDNDERDLAWELAAQAELLCLHDSDQFRQAQRLRERSQGRATVWARAAEPGSVELDDNHSLFLACKGEGSPTVIFEHRGGGTWLDWGDIQPAVSTVTQACAYSRPITGLSDEVRTTQDLVDDLSALLEIAEIEPPYILVGQHMGGLNVILFAGQHSDLVAGIVLVDVSHPEFWGQAIENPTWLDTGGAAFIQENIDDPLTNPEHLDILASSEQAANFDDFGDIPMVVLSDHVHSWATEEGHQAFLAFHEDIASWSTNSRHNIDVLTDSTKSEEEPELVPQLIIEEILWVLDEARAVED